MAEIFLKAQKINKTDYLIGLLTLIFSGSLGFVDYCTGVRAPAKNRKPDH